MKHHIRAIIKISYIAIVLVKMNKCKEPNDDITYKDPCPHHFKYERTRHNC